MSAIEASSVGVKTMADGTLRLSVDIEPRFARDAFALFGSPGTPMALAALKPKADPAPEPPRDKPIAKWLALRGKEPHFQQWLRDRGGYSHDLDEKRCREVVCSWCNVESRGDIDGDENAEKRFHSLIRGPYSKHCIATGATQ